jgi:surface polysaccharide O-acyltransferase-like enzyme
MIYKDKQDVTDKYLSKFIGVTAVLYVAVISLNTVVFSKRYVDIYDGVLGNPLLYVLSALLGSAVVIYISQKVNADNAFFRYISSIGRHSLTVYGLHNIFLVILYSVFAKIGLKSGSGPIEIIRAVIFTAICMIIIVPIGKLLEKLFPILFGYKKRKS